MSDDKPRVVLLLGPEDSTAEALRVLAEQGADTTGVLAGEDAERFMADLRTKSPPVGPDLWVPPRMPAWSEPERGPAVEWHEGENRAQRRRRQRLERKGVINVSAIARSIGPKGCARDDNESNHHAEYIGTDEE